MDDIFPLMTAVLIGSFARKLGHVNKDTTRQLTGFVFFIAIPCMLFHAMTEVSLDMGPATSLLLAYFSASLVVMAAGYAVSLLDPRLDHADRVVLSFAAVFSNSVLLGIPLVLALFGPASSAPLFAIISIHSIVLMTPTAMMVESALGRGQVHYLSHIGQSLKGMLSNTILLSIFIGLAWNLTGLHLPELAGKSLVFLGVAGPPIALFCLGSTLAGYSIRRPGLIVCMITMLKVFVHPLLVWLAGTFLVDVPGDWLVIGIVISALPAGINPYLFAARYNRQEEVVAQIIVYGSMIAALTVPVLVIWSRQIVPF